MISSSTVCHHIVIILRLRLRYKKGLGHRCLLLSSDVMLRHGYGYIMMLLRDPIAAWPMVPDGDPLSRPHYYCHVPHTSPHAIWPGACAALRRGDESWLHCCTCCRPPAISARTRRGFNFKSVLRKQEQEQEQRAAAPSLAGCL